METSTVSYGTDSLSVANDGALERQLVGMLKSNHKYPENYYIPRNSTSKLPVNIFPGWHSWVVGDPLQVLAIAGPEQPRDDIRSCHDEKELPRLAERLDVEFLRPSPFQERKNTIAARYRDVDDTESLDNDTKSLLENCMRRDCRKCVVTKSRLEKRIWKCHAPQWKLYVIPLRLRGLPRYFPDIPS